MYQMHPNTDLGLRRKVKWEKIEISPQEWRFFTIIGRHL